MNNSKFELKNINTYEWFNWQQPAQPIYLGGCFESIFEDFNNIFGINFFTSLLYFRPSNEKSEITLASWLLRLDEGKECGAHLVHILSNAKFSENIGRNFELTCSRLQESGRKLKKLRHSPNEFELEIPTFFNTFKQFYTIGAITEPVQWRVESSLFPSSKKGLFLHGDHDEFKNWDLNRIRDAVFSTQDEPYIYKIEESLSEIIDEALREQVFSKEEIEKNPQIIDKIDAHIGNFNWRINNYGTSMDLPKTFVINEIIENIQNNKNLIKEKLVNARKKRQKTLSDLKKLKNTLDDSFNTITEIGDKFGSGMADRRKEIMLEALEHIRLITEFLSEKTTLPKYLIEQLLPSEIIRFINHPTQYTEKLKNRKDIGLLLTKSRFPLDPNDFNLEQEFLTKSLFSVKTQAMDTFEGNSLTSTLIRINKILNIANLEPPTSIELNGITAYKDENRKFISGKACIIIDPLKDDFITDSILVASSTTPDFMHIIRRAKAIITDQAGLATHAALTSRELEIPCIVGTSNATSLLKTNDLIEIDFENSKVRKKK